MSTASPDQDPPTRKAFRILAGIIAAFLLLVSLPLAISGAFTDSWWESAIWALASLFAGIGMALGARTSRWYGTCA
jgi:protein-S-isoprenylcysteine O-methyltransferase Ste14